MSANFLHPQDQVRNTYFGIMYNWATNIAMLSPTRAFFLAKKKVLAKYPIVPWETFYPITK